MRQILGINYYFGPSDYTDAIFSPERGNDQVVGFVKISFDLFLPKIHSHDRLQLTDPAGFRIVHKWDMDFSPGI